MTGARTLTPLAAACLAFATACSAPATPPSAPNADAALLARVAALVAYDAGQPLDLIETASRDIGDAHLRDVSYRSPVDGRVTAYLVEPRTPGPHPAVLFGHWGSGNRTEFLPEALDLAAAGAVCLLIDYPWERPDPWFRVMPDFDEPQARLELQTHAIVDLRRGLDLLLGRPDVDAGRVAYVGHSYGAQWGAVLAAVDRRPRALVLMGGVPELAAMYLRSNDPRYVRWRAMAPAGSFETLVDVMRDLDAQPLIVHAAPAALLMQFARHERIMTEAEMQAYGAVAPGASVLWYEAGHDLISVEAQADRAAFLARELDLPRLRGLVEGHLREAFEGAAAR